MMPSPTELHYFVEVGKTLNVSRAAERLGISQPTLSLAIQRLEESCGTPLFIRSKSGMTLTHTGQKLLIQVRSLLNEWEKIRGEALKDEEIVRGRYVIGCHPAVALFTAPYFIPQLLKEHTSLELKLVHDLSRKITEDVISFKIDFGIVVNPWEHPDLVIRPLWTDIVELWSAAKPSALQDPHSGEAVLICDPDLAQSQSLMKQLQKHKIRVQRTITSSSLSVIRSLVASGAGLGILPGRVAELAEPGSLKPLMKNGPKFVDKHSLIYRADAQKSHANRQLAKNIENHLLKRS